MARFRKRDLRKNPALAEAGKPRKADTRRRQKAHGEGLREWLLDRGRKKEEALKEEAESRRAAESVDRTPAKVKYAPSGTDEVLTPATDDNYATRRRQARANGTVLRPSMNRPAGYFQQKGAAAARPGYREGWRTKSTSRGGPFGPREN